MVLPPKNNLTDDFRKRLDEIFAGVTARVEDEKSPDEKDKEEERKLDKEKKRAEIKNDQTLTDLRGRYGQNIIHFMWVYFISVILILIIDATSPNAFHLPDNVLVALVVGTAVSGIVGAVASNLFKPPPKS